MALCFGPAMLGLGAWIFIMYFSWPHILAYFSNSSWLSLLLSILGLLVLLPAMAVTGLALTSVLAMPMITSYVHKIYFPTLEKKRGFGLVASIKNSAFFWLLYMVLLVPSLVTWFIPFLGAAVTVALNSFANRKILYFDAMAEFSSKEEFKEILKMKSKEIWLLSLAIALCMMVPGYFLIAPVHAGVVFTRFTFEELENLRRGKI